MAGAERSREEELFIPLFMTVLAESEAEARNPDQALAILDRGTWKCRANRATRGQCRSPSSARRKTPQVCPPEETAAETAFMRSIEIARSQAAKCSSFMPR